MNYLRTNYFLSALFISILFLFSSCKPENPSGGEEQITTVNLTFSNGPTVSWKEGGTTPEITLDANTTYTVKAEFLDETDPADVENITEEIIAEDDEHLVCYTISGGADLSITRTDSDGQYEVGIDSSWETAEASMGTVLLKLRHQPGVKDGSCDPGDSDVEVTFNITIQ